MTTTQTPQAHPIAGVTEAWNGNAYRITIVATVEANSAEEAQVVTGQLLAGISTEQGHAALPLTGVGSWAPDTKTVECIAGPDAA